MCCIPWASVNTSEVYVTKQFTCLQNSGIGTVLFVRVFLHYGSNIINFNHFCYTCTVLSTGHINRSEPYLLVPVFEIVRDNQSHHPNKQRCVNHSQHQQCQAHGICGSKDIVYHYKQYCQKIRYYIIYNCYGYGKCLNLPEKDLNTVVLCCRATHFHDNLDTVSHFKK